MCFALLGACTARSRNAAMSLAHHPLTPTESITLQGQITLSPEPKPPEIHWSDHSVSCFSYGNQLESARSPLDSNGSYRVALNRSLGLPIQCWLMREDAPVAPFTMSQSTLPNFGDVKFPQSVFRFTHPQNTVGGSYSPQLQQVNLTEGSVPLMPDEAIAPSLAFDLTGHWRRGTLELILPAGATDASTLPDDYALAPIPQEFFLQRWTGTSNTGDLKSGYALQVWQSQAVAQGCGRALGVSVAQVTAAGLDFSDSSLNAGLPPRPFEFTETLLDPVINKSTRITQGYAPESAQFALDLARLEIPLQIDHTQYLATYVQDTSGKANVVLSATCKDAQGHQIALSAPFRQCTLQRPHWSKDFDQYVCKGGVTSATPHSWASNVDCTVVQQYLNADQQVIAPGNAPSQVFEPLHAGPQNIFAGKPCTDLRATGPLATSIRNACVLSYLNRMVSHPAISTDCLAHPRVELDDAGRLAVTSANTDGRPFRPRLMLLSTLFYLDSVHAIASDWAYPGGSCPTGGCLGERAFCSSTLNPIAVNWFFTQLSVDQMLVTQTFLPPDRSAGASGSTPNSACPNLTAPPPQTIMYIMKRVT